MIKARAKVLVNKENSSPVLRVNSVDVAKTLRGMFVTFLGGLVTYFAGVYTTLNYVVTIKGNTYDLTFIAVAVFGGIIELARRYLADYTNYGE